LSGKSISSMACFLSGGDGEAVKPGPRRFRIVDKHGLSRHAYNLQIQMELEGQKLSLGLDGSKLPHKPSSAPEAGSDPGQRTAAPSAEEMIDDLASMLRKRSVKAMTED